MQVSITDHPNGATVLAIHGDLDIDTGPVLHNALEQALARPRPRLVVDLTGVQFCDSTGLSQFVVGHRRAVSLGGGLRLAGPSRWLHQLLGTVGLTRELIVHRDVSEAVATV
jgi:anti-anti-sigma factor